MALLMTSASGAVLAEEVTRGQSVADRDRPDLNPLGIRTGGFRWFPEVGLELGYNDNIFATESNEQNDLVTVITPNVMVESDWGRHRLAAGADARLGRYADFDNEDYDDWWVWSEGRMDLDRSQLRAEVRAGNQHNPRTNANDQGPNAGLNPTTYDVARFEAGWTFKPARVMFRIDGDIETRTYDDNMGLDGAGGFTSIDNAHRDRDNANLRLRVGMDMTPDYMLFVQGRVQSVEYDQKIDQTCLGGDPTDPASWCERSFDGWSMTAGSVMDFSGDFFGEFRLGYRVNEYDDPRFGKQDGPTYGLGLTWNVTGLTSLEFSGQQSVAPTTIIGSSGIDRSTLGVRIDHELLRQLLLHASVRWTKDDFQNLDRSDDIINLDIGGRYILNRNFELTFGYDFATSDTNPSAAGGLVYDVSRVYAALKAQI
jgi:hypothetical protein